MFELLLLGAAIVFVVVLDGLNAAMMGLESERDR
jgi:hypothetical protein